MYWPKEGSETYGIITVKLLQEVVMATYILRTFSIRNSKVKKVIITQFPCYHLIIKEQVKPGKRYVPM